MKLTLPPFLGTAREKLTSILDLKLWNRTPSAMPIHLSVSQPSIPAPPCRIMGDSPASCMAAYHEAMERGPDGGVRLHHRAAAGLAHGLQLAQRDRLAAEAEIAGNLALRAVVDGEHRWIWPRAGRQVLGGLDR